jgi:carbohydrate-selective porin OprB
MLKMPLLRQISRATKAHHLVFLVFALVWCSAKETYPQDAHQQLQAGYPSSSEHTRSYLFGSWNGKRGELAAKGIVFDFFHIEDLQANPVGGLRQTQAGWGRIRGTMDIDFGRLKGWNGLTFHATGVWQFGKNLGMDIGALADPSGLASAHGVRMDSFWIQQAFLKNRLLVRVGQFGGLDFFGDQEYGPSYVMEPLNYAFGNLISSTYESFAPAGTPAALIEVIPWRTVYVKSAVLSGNRNPFEQDPNGLHFAIRDTPVFANEIGFTHDAEATSGQATGYARKRYPAVYKFGTTYNAGKFTDSAGNQRNGNYLIYGMANQAIFRSEAGSNKGLDLTLAFDWSPGDISRENSQITAGARYSGAIPDRPQDTVAFGFVHTKIGDPYRSVGISLGNVPLGSEKAIEINYGAIVKPYLLLQPVFQYYWDVGGNSRVPNAAVLGFRVIVDF